ncbi:hypothetical protein R1flu_016030 [Riccia fluitans]|uniref:Uncharacterized protein n=1 Tax=Riccia fluitans TaxID=41844 RepID=A0ABD1YNT3_9MARC
MILIECYVEKVPGDSAMIRAGAVDIRASRKKGPRTIEELRSKCRQLPHCVTAGFRLFRAAICQVWYPTSELDRPDPRLLSSYTLARQFLWNPACSLHLAEGRVAICTGDT